MTGYTPLSVPLPDIDTRHLLNDDSHWWASEQQQCLWCNRTLEQARQQLTSEFAAERDALLKEVQLTKQQQQGALAQAHKGAPCSSALLPTYCD